MRLKLIGCAGSGGVLAILLASCGGVQSNLDEPKTDASETPPETASNSSALSAVPGAEQTKWVTWTDPTERAFTIQVPRGWKTTGGINRRYLALLCEKVVTTSPDGGVWVYIGNDFPAFIPPNPVYDSIGVGEGMTAPLPPGSIERNPYIVRR
jgi:hypothetical protein